MAFDEGGFCIRDGDCRVFLMTASTGASLRRIAALALVALIGVSAGVWVRPYVRAAYHHTIAQSQLPQPRLPHLYAAKMGQFERLDEIATNTSVVYVGDSITDWMHVHEFIASSHGATLNRAISGDTTMDASSLFGVGNLGDHRRVVLDGQTRRAASESPIVAASVAVSRSIVVAVSPVPRRPPGCPARGKKAKEGVWGNLRSWFPQIAQTDSAEEPKR